MSVARRKRPKGPAGPQAVRDALVRDLSALASRTARRDHLRTTEVHAVRKALKRARATLALLRPAIDEDSFAACDDALRQAGRCLATARDAAVLARVEAQTRTRLGLEAKRARATPVERTASVTATHRAHKQLRAALLALHPVQLADDGWPLLGKGLRGVYRRGRRRMPARKRGIAAENLHAWRRHAKRWWHVLEIFEPVAPERLAPLIDAARRLSDLLGDEHDLAMLVMQLERRSARSDDTAAMLRGAIERRRKLTRRALRLGRKVYAERPKEVERAMREDWERWRGIDAAPDAGG